MWRIQCCVLEAVLKSPFSVTHVWSFSSFYEMKEPSLGSAALCIATSSIFTYNLDLKRYDRKQLKKKNIVLTPGDHNLDKPTHLFLPQL